MIKKNEKNNKRFHNLQDLDLFYLAAPHQKKLYGIVSRKVKEAIHKCNPGRKDLKEFINIIDIGCGSGATAIPLLEADKRVRVIGVDNDTGMIRQIKNNLSDYIENERLELFEKDALEFLKKQKNDSLNIIISGFVIHNFKKGYRLKVLREIYRVLKPEGVFINADKIMPDDPKAAEEEMRLQIERFQNIPDESVRNEWIKHYEVDMQPDTVLKESEFIKTLKDLGFREVNVDNRMHLEALVTAKK